MRAPAIGLATFLVAAAGCVQIEQVELPAELETAGAAAMVLEYEGDTWISVGDHAPEGWKFPPRPAEGTVRLLAYAAGSSDAHTPSPWSRATSEDGWKACLGEAEFTLGSVGWSQECLEPLVEEWEESQEPARIQEAARALAMIPWVLGDGRPGVLVLADDRSIYEVSEAGPKLVPGPEAIGLATDGQELVVLRPNGQLLHGPSVEGLVPEGSLQGPWEDYPIDRVALAVEADRVLAVLTTRELASGGSQLVDWVAEGPRGSDVEALLVATKGLPGFIDARPRASATLPSHVAWVVLSNLREGHPLRWQTACGLSVRQKPTCLPLPQTPQEKRDWDESCAVSTMPCANGLGALASSVVESDGSLLALAWFGDVFAWAGSQWVPSGQVPGDPSRVALGFLPARAGRPAFGIRGPPSPDSMEVAIQVSGRDYISLAEALVIESAAMRDHNRVCRPQQVVWASVTLNEGLVLRRFARRSCTPVG